MRQDVTKILYPCDMKIAIEFLHDLNRIILLKKIIGCIWEESQIRKALNSPMIIRDPIMKYLGEVKYSLL